jgi:glycosyltransferase involved in cell wall biosynthesis
VMRILHVVPHAGPESGGPSYTVLGIAKALAGHGHEVLVLSARDSASPPAERFTHRVFPLSMFFRRAWRSPALKREIFQQAPRSDIIHSHGMWVLPAAYPGQAARRFGKPLVISPHGCLSPTALKTSPIRKHLAWHLLHRRAFESSACFHATSESEYLDIRRAGLRSPVAIIPHGIWAHEVPSDKGAAREPRILYLGRIHPIKGLDTLLDAWQMANAEDSQGWSLRIVGPDEQGHQLHLQRRVEAEGIDRVEFSGPVYGGGKWNEYQGAALSVLPSRSENFGMTVLESLVAGTPVITTREVPWPQLEQLGIGWRVDLSAPQLAEALRVAMSLTRDARSEMGSRGRDWAMSSFAWPEVARRMALVYEWLLRGGAPPADVRVH